MPLYLVNKSTSPVDQDHVPGHPIQVGIRSYPEQVNLGDLNVGVGLSNLVFRGALPEDDEVLRTAGMGVSFETAERRRPITGTVSKTISSGKIKLLKSTNAEGERGIYELKFPINEAASVLGYLKIRRKNWGTFSPDWLNLDSMTGMYFGLEHGTYNTAGYAFLRDNGNGTVVVGGPLQTYGANRPGQVEIGTLPWKTLSDGMSIELWLFFNTRGYAPDYIPVFEVWTVSPIDGEVTLLAQIPVGELGQFGKVVNPRTGYSNFATLFFGNDGVAGDELIIEDWALYPDYRLAVERGEPTVSHGLKMIVDLPISYRADSNLLPDQISPGPWAKGIGSLPIQDSLYFQPGRREKALYASMTKEGMGIMNYERVEPAIESRLDGFSVEARVSGVSRRRDGDGTGMGFGVDDGVHVFEVHMMDTDAVQTFALRKNAFSIKSLQNDFHLDQTLDYRGLKLIRLIVDRRRGKVDLYGDGKLLARRELTDVFPASFWGRGKIFFGHIGNANTAGDFQLSFINILTRYLAWDASDGFLPDAVGVDYGVRFTQRSNGVGSDAVISGGKMTITKPSYGVAETGSSYFRDLLIQDVPGAQIEFRTRIPYYADRQGRPYVPNCNSGVGLNLFLGTRAMKIRFLDCGIHGKKVAILPGSGSEDDILRQTPLGRAFSASVDWEEWQNYRIVYRSFHSIELWIGETVGEPRIVIPWRDDTRQFDLPLDLTQQRIEFGHLTDMEASSSDWEYLRWGFSGGFDVAVTQSYPEGIGRHVFGGRILAQININPEDE